MTNCRRPFGAIQRVHPASSNDARPMPRYTGRTTGPVNNRSEEGTRVKTVLVVGGGLSGAHTCEQLRTHGFEGTIIMIGDEPHPPYDRPPLSKDVLTAGRDRPELPIEWDRLAVDRRLGVAATDLTFAGDRWVVTTTSGDVHAECIVIATGARPRGLVGTATLGANIVTLRTWNDAVNLRANLCPPARVVMIGAGWIGAEVASSAVEMGCEVTVVEAERTPLSKALGTDVGARIAAWYSEAGAHLIVGERVTEVSGENVTLAGGETIGADVVVVGVGVIPNTEWLGGSGIQLDAQGGVVVNENLQTGATGVYAVGDCASYASTRYGTRLRPEHWTNAQQGGAAVAAHIVGREPGYDPVPYFWSRQFGRMVQYCGHHTVTDELMYRGDPTGPKWAACWVSDGYLNALLTVNKPGECLVARQLLTAYPQVVLQKLKDQDVPIVDALLKS
jgi:3-phenylpropionate/trans-cinnamate dioxygenase ferredoxin reductase subunit